MQPKPEAPSRPSGYLLLSLVFLLVLGLTVFFLRRPEPQPLELLIPSPTPEATPEPLGIYILGAVERPGVYFLPAGSRVLDAIDAAGGATADADLARVNLAARLKDEMQIYIPEVEEGNSPLPIISTPQSTLININTASAVELESLPGIGPLRAQSIVEYRAENGLFSRIEDILEVDGISEEVFNQIRDLITVG